MHQDDGFLVPAAPHLGANQADTLIVFEIFAKFLPRMPGFFNAGTKGSEPVIRHAQNKRLDFLNLFPN
jgi:hypothetical protein